MWNASQLLSRIGHTETSKIRTRGERVVGSEKVSYLKCVDQILKTSTYSELYYFTEILLYVVYFLRNKIGKPTFGVYPQGFF